MTVAIFASQQPRRAARALLASPRSGSRCADSRTGARAGSCWPACAWASASRRRCCVALVVVPGIAAAWLWVRAGARARGCTRCGPAAGRRRGDDARRRRLAAARRTHAGLAAALDLGHERQPRPVADLRIQRRRPRRRPGRRAGRPGGGSQFGGSTGPLRLLNSALGGQAGWLLGFAARQRARAAPRQPPAPRRRAHAAGCSRSAAPSPRRPSCSASRAASSTPTTSRCWRRSPPRWWAPGSRTSSPGARARASSPRWRSPPASRPSSRCCGDYPGQLRWLVPVLIGLCGARRGRARRRATRAGCVSARRCSPPASLLIAPVGLGRRHARAHAQRHLPRRRPGRRAQWLRRSRRRRPGWRTRRLRRPAPARPRGRFALPGAGGFAGPGRSSGGGLLRPGGFAGPGGFAPPRCGLRLGARAAGPGGAGGGFGAIRSARRSSSYVKAHGGGTIAVSSQSSAAGSIISDGADVAGIGGFSGRESSVSVSWLAQEVREGKIRWVLDEESSSTGTRSAPPVPACPPRRSRSSAAPAAALRPGRRGASAAVPATGAKALAKRSRRRRKPAFA